MRGLFERGLAADEVRKLFRLIDWLMTLPPPLDAQFRDELTRIEEEKHMPYITSVERLAKEEGREEGWEKGLKRGIRAVLQARFGEAGLHLHGEIDSLHDGDLLETILDQAHHVSSPEQLRQFWKRP